MKRCFIGKIMKKSPLYGIDIEYSVSAFSFILTHIDDVLSINDDKFSIIYVNPICPMDLETKDTMCVESSTYALYLDVLLNIGQWRQNEQLNVMTNGMISSSPPQFPRLYTNIPRLLAYGVYIPLFPHARLLGNWLISFYFSAV
jgi:hypothetical protein